MKAERPTVLFSMPHRVVGGMFGLLFLWVVGDALIGLRGRESAAEGIAVIGTVTVIVGGFFWGALRARVELGPDSMMIVGFYSRVEVPKADVRSIDIRGGSLWGEQVYVHTSEKSFPVAALQAGSRGLDLFRFRRAMRHAVFVMDKWLRDDP
jgi:hypothetical protein